MKRIHMRFPQGLAKCLTLSYDDGVIQDMRLAELLKKHKIACTFNINSGLYGGGRRMTAEQCQQVYNDPLFEVSTHTVDHVSLATVPAPKVVQQVIDDRVNLESQFGGVCRGHAYANGSYNEQVMALLADCGIAYARTTKSTEGYALPKNWLALHPTCHHKNPRLQELGDTFLYETTVGEPWMFYLWGHSYEFDDHDNWHIIENFCDNFSGHNNVWYATNIAICDYVRDWNRLVWSVDCNRVYNPTARDLWVCVYPDHKHCVIQCIPAGQTEELV